MAPKTMLKTCYVRLNRNFMDSLGTMKVNNLSVRERKNVENSSGSKNFCTTSYAKVGGNNYKLRKEGKVNYADENRPNMCGDTSLSEFSEDDSSSNDDTVQENVREKIKNDLSKRKELKMLNCLHCNKSFSSHSSYLIHKRSHLIKQFKCILCNMFWKYRQSFIHHMKRYHPEVKPFLCEYQGCELSFKTQKLLEMHNKMHLKYMCKFCKKSFALKYHMRKHVSKTH